MKDSAALPGVVDHLHLNPVKAKVVTPEQLIEYQLSSLSALITKARPAKPVCRNLPDGPGWLADNGEGVTAYAEYLVALAGVVGLSKGWAIGTDGWRRALAKEQAQLHLQSAMAASEWKALRKAGWEAALADNLSVLGKAESDLKTKPRKQPWKLDLALNLRSETGTSIAWLAEWLDLGKHLRHVVICIYGLMPETKKAH